MLLRSHTAIQVQQMLSANCSHTAQILNHRVPGQVIGQVNQVLHRGHSLMLECSLKLLHFLGIKATHPLGKIVHLVQVHDFVFQASQFSRLVYAQHEALGRQITGRFQNQQFLGQVIITAGKVNIDVALAPSNSHIDHFLSPHIVCSKATSSVCSFGR